MAKAISNIKRTKVQGDITLTLTPEEAIYLKALLGITVELDDQEDVVVTQYKTAEKYSVDIWNALDQAGVPHVTNVFIDYELQVSAISLSAIERSVERF